MNISINGKPLDFTLEDENRLKDVVKSLESWLGENQLYISEVVLDGKTVSLSDESPWLQESILNDTVLEIEALSPRELKAKHMLTIISYFQMLQQSVSDAESSLLKQLSSDWNFVLESLCGALGSPTGDLIKDHLNSQEQELGIFSGNELSSESKSAFILELNQIIQVLDSRVKELQDPWGEAQKASTVIQGLIPQIEEVSVFLQTGRDKEAMGLLVHVIELIQKVIRVTFLLNSADNDKRDSVDSFISDLNEILKEMEEAFQSDDSVLIGDLVEYELIARLQGIPEFLNSLNFD